MTVKDMQSHLRGFCCSPLVLLVSWPVPARAGNDPPIDYERARFERRLVIERAAGGIVIDGALEEPDWQRAPVASRFIQSEPREGEPASHDTEVRLLYDKQNLYLGVLARDSEPDKLVVNDLRRDFNTFSGDVFGVVIDTFHDERNGYLFETSPMGAQFDAQMVNEGREINRDWDGVWYVASRAVEAGWTVEMAIPFKTLKFRGLAVETWGINFLRRIRRLNEDSYWAPLPRIHDLMRVSLAGTVENLRELRPGANTKLTPFVTVERRDGEASATEGRLEGGLDAKLAVGSGLSLDLTLNTDFSQVEADVQQVNLTRFSLFFPEKRDFFLENSGIFRFGPPEEQRVQQFQAQFGGTGSATNIRGGQTRGDDLLLFFSRRIGLSPDGEPIPIAGGGRLTGRLGPYELGFLSIQTEASRSGPGENFAVFRLKRNLLARSDIGLMLINRETFDSPHYNRSFGVDANFRLTPEMDLLGYLAKSATPDLPGKDLAARVGWSYNGSLVEARLAYSTLQDHFRPEVGFAPRIGIRRSSNYFGYHYRQPWWRGQLREINPHLELEYFTDQKGLVITRYVNVHLPLRMQNGAFFEMGRNQNLERLVQPFAIDPKVAIAEGLYTFPEYFLLIFSDQSRTLSANGRYSWGEFYSGSKRSLNLGGSLKLGERLNAQLDWSTNDVRLREGEFVTHLLTTRFNYSFSTRMFLDGLIQYNSVIGEWSSNIRFNFIHRPLSDLYLVYNERRDSETGRRLDRALIAKFTYLLSF